MFIYLKVEFPKSETKTSRTQRIDRQIHNHSSFNTCLYLIAKSSSITKEVEAVKDAVDQLVLMDIYRTLNIMIAEYTLFSKMCY